MLVSRRSTLEWRDRFELPFVTQKLAGMCVNEGVLRGSKKDNLGLFGVELSPPIVNANVEALAFSTSECDLVCKQV